MLTFRKNRKFASKLLVHAAIFAVLFASSATSIEAAGLSDPNAAYFKDHGYSSIDGSGVDTDTNNNSGLGPNVAAAYKALQADSSAVVIKDQAGDDYVQTSLKFYQGAIKANYYQLVADYTVYKQQLDAFEKNPSTNEYYTNAHGTTTLKFETTGGFVDIAVKTYENIADNPWLLLFGGQGLTAAGEIAFVQNQIVPRIQNAGNSVNYWEKMQEDRKNLDDAISNVHALIYISHSKNPLDSKGGYWRNSADDLYSSDQNKGKDDPKDPTVAYTIFKVAADGSFKPYTRLSDFLKDYGPYDLNGTIAKPIDEIGGVSAAAQDTNGTSLNNATRCGGHSSASFLNFLDLTYDICVVVDTVSQFSDTLLLSAAQLLATTAGLPGASKDLKIPVKTSYHPSNSAYVVPQSNIWGTIIPSDISTPFQTLMVDQNSSVGKTVASTASIVNKLLDVILVFAFLASALASILQIQTNVLGFRKLIPGLILGFIVAQASFFIIRAGLEVVGQTSTAILSLATADPNTDTGNVFQDYVNAISNVRGDGGSACFTDSPHPDCGGNDTNSHVNNGRVFQQSILNIFVVGGAIVLFILGFLFGARVFIFTLAVPLAPLAVLCRFIPPLNFVWTRWSKTVIAWILMPLPVMLLFVLSAIYFKSASGLESKDGVGLFGYMIDYAAGMVFLLAAIKLPFSMAGEGKAVLDRFNALGKAGYNQAGGQALKNQYGAVSSGFKARSEAMSKNAGMSSPFGRAALAFGGALKKDAESKDDMHKAIETRGHNDAKHLWESKKGTALKYILGNKNLFTQKEVGKEAFRMQTQQDIIKGKHDADDADWAEKQKEKILSEDDGKYAKIMAQTEKIKELTGQIADIFKSEIKMRKERLLEDEEDYHKLRARQTIAKRNAETEETRKELSYRGDKFKDIASGTAGYYDQDVQFAENESEIQGEVRTKAAEQSQRPATLKISQTTSSLDSLETLFRKFDAGNGTDIDSLVAVEHAKMISADSRYGKVLKEKGFDLEAELAAAGTDQVKVAAVKATFKKVIRDGFEKDTIDGRLAAATNIRVRNKDKSIIVEQAKADVDNGDIASNINFSIDPAKEAKEIGSSDIYKQARILGGLGGTIIDPGNDKNIQTWAGGSIAMHSTAANNSSEIATVYKIIQDVGALQHINDPLTDAAIDRANDNIDAANAQIVAMGDGKTITLGNGAGTQKLEFKSGKNNAGGGLTEFFRVLREDVTDPRDRQRIIALVENTGALNHIYLDKGTAGNPTKLKTSRNVDNP